MKPILFLNNIVISQGENFSLTIEKMELMPQRIYALTGPNGAGKSTLLRALALLIKPQQGCIEFTAEGVDNLSSPRQQVTLVDQSPYLFQGTVADNLAFGLKLRGIRGKEQQKRIKSLLSVVGLNGFEQRKANKLSGGEIQRVALARALVLEPKVLLLDEPTSNIDCKSVQIFEDLIRKLPSYGVTVVLSTHDLTQPERIGASHIQIENGRILNRLHSSSEFKQKNQMEKQLWLKPLNAQGL